MSVNEAVYAMTIYHDCFGSPTIDVKLFKTKEAAKKKAEAASAEE